MIKTCGIYLINNKNEVLICHPTNHPWNVWSIPKGLLDKDETELEAAKRELWEETNIKLDKIEHSEPIRLKDTLYLSGKKTLVAFKINIKELINSDDLVCSSWVDDKFPEVDDFRWVSIDDARKLLHNSQIDNLDLLND